MFLLKSLRYIHYRRWNNPTSFGWLDSRGHAFTGDEPIRFLASAAALRSASPRNTVLFSPATRAVAPEWP
jgi:hypothetical protein